MIGCDGSHDDPCLVCLPLPDLFATHPSVRPRLVVVLYCEHHQSLVIFTYFFCACGFFFLLYLCDTCIALSSFLYLHVQSSPSFLLSLPYSILAAPHGSKTIQSGEAQNTSTKTRKFLLLRLLPPFFSLPSKSKFNALLSLSPAPLPTPSLESEKKATVLDSVCEMSITKRRERTRRNIGWRSWNLIKGGGRRQWVCVRVWECMCVMYVSLMNALRIDSHAQHT